MSLTWHENLFGSFCRHANITGPANISDIVLKLLYQIFLPINQTIMQYNLIRDIFSKLLWQKAQDTEENLQESKLLRDQQLQDVDPWAEREIFDPLTETQKYLAKWKMIAVLSTTMSLFISLSWVARELRTPRGTLMPSILCEWAEKS
jgi:hypothetical protein